MPDRFIPNGMRDTRSKSLTNSFFEPFPAPRGLVPSRGRQEGDRRGQLLHPEEVGAWASVAVMGLTP